MKKVRVLVVEDSAVVRELVCEIVSRDSRLELAGAVDCAEEALLNMSLFAPDVISLDIRLPGMNGLEATRRIMRERPTPIVVVAAAVDSDDLNITMNALRCGALAVVEKPAAVESVGFQDVAQNISTQLYIMSQVKVVRQRERVPLSPRVAARTPGELPWSGRPNPPLRILALGCSTGGPNALSVLLRDVADDIACPIVLVQHLPPSFIASFAAWIESICALRVELVDNVARMLPGHIYVAGPSRHLSVSGDLAVAFQGAPIGGQLPSATALFRSVAREFGSAAAGVLLTGMGDDGAEGLLEMRRAGAYTIAEDQSTAIVYGMPAVAVAIGAVCESLPLPRIGQRIRELCLTARDAW